MMYIFKIIKRKLILSAARLVPRVKHIDHITPVLRTLHWLPVNQRIALKVLLFTYKVIHA